MENKKKPVCIHFHIFKNAGTTIDSVLEENFNKQAVRLDIEKNDEILPMDVVINYLNFNPNVKSISCHQIRFPLPKNISYNLIPMLFIRHPIDRVFSIYHYNKRRKDKERIVSQLGMLGSPEVYIKSLLEHKTNRSAQNFQVLFLSKNDLSSQLNTNDFNLALTRIRNCPILGIVDRLDESLVVAEEFLKNYFPNIDLAYSPRNISEERNTDLNKKLKESRTQVSSKLWDKLMSENELDLKLYSNAINELETRIQKIDNFAEKVTNFKKRLLKKNKPLPENQPMLKNPRFWYSPEQKTIYHKHPVKGNESILKFNEKQKNFQNISKFWSFKKEK